MTEVRGADALVEGSLLVAELGAVPGLAVWRALRDVRRWDAEGAPPVLPAAAAPLPEELWAPLAVVACLADGAPDRLRLRHACRRIARWAEARRAWRTALAWEAEAARIRDTGAPCGVTPAHAPGP